MVVFVDLEQDYKDGDHTPTEIRDDGGSEKPRNEELDETTPTLSRDVVTRLFNPYPIAIAVASHIDLNTLDSLAQTCLAIRLNLLQYRSALIRSTLRCCNEDLVPDPSGTDVFRMRAQARLHWVPTWRNNASGFKVENNGKTGVCARDRVSECRRCGVIVCRNCTIKPPGDASLRDRHRRLCSGCTRAPLGTLAKPPLDPSTTLDSWIMRYHVCQCDSEGVYLCQPCGRSIRAADSDYTRLWKWRIRYGEVLGGLGTGIGDGDRGAICGREADCFFARECEQELDSDAEDARDSNMVFNEGSSTPPTTTPELANGTSAGPVASTTTTTTTSLSSSSTPFTLTLVGGNYHASYPQHSGSTSSHTDLPDSLRNTGGPDSVMLRTSSPGYDRHEIQGIGGVLKGKRLRMVRVGACVVEREEEMAGRIGVLSREIAGESRSWCGWCQRVIPGAKDRTEAVQYSTAGER